MDISKIRIQPVEDYVQYKGYSILASLMSEGGFEWFIYKDGAAVAESDLFNPCNNEADATNQAKQWIDQQDS